jgi:ribose 5-phosphate isomerase B
MRKAKLAVGCDHAGFEYKEALKSFLEKLDFQVDDFGTNSKESVDYPDYVHPLAESIESGKNDLGILICGSANGVAITANKHRHIRAAIAWQNDIAALSRQHNNANVICLPARFITIEQAQQFVLTFINTPFEGGRHAIRVNKIASA